MERPTKERILFKKNNKIDVFIRQATNMKIELSMVGLTLLVIIAFYNTAG